MTTSKGALDGVYPALLAILNNIGPYVEGLSPATVSKILQLFSSMSSPSFLLANETNHTILASYLDFINIILEHQFSSKPSFLRVSMSLSNNDAENPYLVYGILKARRRFQKLRQFTLENGQEEMERQAQQRKAGSSQDSSQPVDDQRRGSRSSLTHIPEENGPFAIGDDDSDEEEQGETVATPAQSAPSSRNSRTPSVSSSADDNAPLQQRRMSEKARGKMPAGQATFSRQNSVTSLSSHAATIHSASASFTPTAAWVSSWIAALRSCLQSCCLQFVRSSHGYLNFHSTRS